MGRNEVTRAPRLVSSFQSRGFFFPQYPGRTFHMLKLKLTAIAALTALLAVANQGPPPFPEKLAYSNPLNGLTAATCPPTVSIACTFTTPAVLACIASCESSYDSNLDAAFDDLREEFDDEFTRYCMAYDAQALAYTLAVAMGDDMAAFDAAAQASFAEMDFLDWFDNGTPGSGEGGFLGRIDDAKEMAQNNFNACMRGCCERLGGGWGITPP